MLGFFTAVYSFFAFIFAFVGIAFVSYQLYQWYLKRRINSAQPNQEFESIRRERLQRGAMGVMEQLWEASHNCSITPIAPISARML